MASTSSDPQQQPITLHFQNLVRVAGETIEGCVDLHVPLLRKDGIEILRIEMQGVIKTFGDRFLEHTGRSPLCTNRPSLSFLRRVNHYGHHPIPRRADSDVVSLPFRFTLPKDLPPSFAFGSYSATVRYSLEVVGERPGVFHRNRRVRRVLVVMPAATESQLIARESLRQGWNGPWKATTQDEKVSLPDLPQFPISTPVPYTLHVVTETKTLDRSDRPEDKHGKRYSPSRLLSPLICFAPQHRIHRSRSQALASTTEMKKVRRAQTAPTQPMEPAGEVHTITDEPEWVPKDDKERGIWRRSVRFTSTLAFPFAPTSTTETLRWSYTLLFTISFPGIGNDLKLEVPVHLGPASACPPFQPALRDLRISRTQTFSPLDPLRCSTCLRATYWAGDNQDWDDEKDEKN
ncbi:hypothetical protein B0H14DRAFT_2578921 [Mycena olivaceomarginata]|nr:hypothetical protein B0H14DRAFT_2578921 [Mycena olivaceomarginata]